MFAVAPNARGRAAPPAPGLGWQRLRVRRPDAQCRLHAHHIGQTHGCDASTERAVNAVAGVGQQHPGRDAGFKRSPDLIERDLRLGLENHVVRDTGLLAPRFVRRPILRQIQTIGDRQARRVTGDRQRHRDLTIVGLAEPPAILPRHAHRVHALLGEACVVDDPSLDLALRFDRRQDKFAHLAQQGLVRPSRLPNQMEQRLMFRRDTSGRHNRRHRLDALALARHQQPRAIILERSRPIFAAQNRRQGNSTYSVKRASLDCASCPIFAPLDIQPNQQDSKSQSATNLRKRDSVELGACPSNSGILWRPGRESNFACL